MPISTIGQSGLNAPLSLTTPALGTPSSLVLTNATGLPQAGLATGVAGTGPAFYVTKSGSQSITGNSTTKVTFDTKVFDTASIFSTSTSILTPTVAGYYLINVILGFGAASTSGQINLYKNGSLAMNAPPASYNSSIGGQMVLTSLISVNGTTDYLEIYTYGPSTMTISASSQNTQFSGYLVRSA